ncbi:methylmalonyl-CoA epimerase [Rhizobium sp. CC-YZS058]|uniref:methylmalonyl-CoA epimerase n=1 Tax=Rhizobium sp. CC-YZS058 TaxID=3042153 RepID=UPI002B059644|nr:methylmalonyl-CoA epimerase [Rhizobium sp. CC-YZS058]MEA3536768.1 methylmalonyl-CoA epimerase [Rhizobium sp. CC-YZS058]
MFGRLNHVAIAVPDLEAAMAHYQSLGGTISAVQALPEHGVTVAFAELPNSKIELLHPLGGESPIAAFLARNPAGGIHHLCFEVDDLDATRARLLETGHRLLGDGTPRIGAHGKPVLFVHPKDLFGTLMEFEEA